MAETTFRAASDCRTPQGVTPGSEPSGVALSAARAWKVLRWTNRTCYELLRNWPGPPSTPGPETPTANIKGAGCWGEDFRASARKARKSG
jgi:hypothetical protein